MCVMCYVMLGTEEGGREGGRRSPGSQTIRNYHNNNNTTNTGTVVTIATLHSDGKRFFII